MSQVADEFEAQPTLAREEIFAGRVWDVVAEDVDLGHSVVRREFVAHPGAVAVVAIDPEDRVLLLKQYRHPVRGFLWEPPAGLLDVEGEDPVDAARRELAEEADLVAGTWEHLVSFRSTPGGSSEEIIVYLARDLAPVPEAERHVRTEEEADLEPVWVPFDEAVAGVLEGRLHSPTAVVGILATHARRTAS
ncbi:MAG: NUDIX hydrolase [Actinomycetales bacterium]|nr:NUDIX hydrolase [Actinomycetales bacterium]